MGWKELSYWFRGGLLAVLIIPIISIILIFFTGGMFELLFLLFLIPSMMFCGFDGGGIFGSNSSFCQYNVDLVISFVFDIFIIFLIGALIGLIVGKIRSKNNPNSIQE